MPLLSPLSLARFLTIKDNSFVVVHYVECLIESCHALEIDAAVKQTRTVEAAAEHGPVEPVLSVC